MNDHHYVEAGHSATARADHHYAPIVPNDDLTPDQQALVEHLRRLEDEIEAARRRDKELLVERDEFVRQNADQLAAVGWRRLGRLVMGQVTYGDVLRKSVGRRSVD